MTDRTPVTDRSDLLESDRDARLHREEVTDRRSPLLPVLLGLLALGAVAAILFFAFGGDADVDTKGGDVDIETPSVDADIEGPDVDVDTPSVDVDPGGVDVKPGDAEADAG